MLVRFCQNFLTCLAFLSLSNCQTWEPQNYKFVYKYHPIVTGGVEFGVLDNKFRELSESEITELLKTSVIMPAKTWEMISVDLVKACVMLGKKCSKEVDLINGIFSHLIILNKGLK